MTEDVCAAYLAMLSTKAPGPIDIYRRILAQFTAWLTGRPGCGHPFQVAYLMTMAVDTYLNHLAARGQSLSHQTRVKTVISGFASWLITDRGLLQRTPTRSIILPPHPLYAPRQLNADQR